MDEASQLQKIDIEGVRTGLQLLRILAGSPSIVEAPPVCSGYMARDDPTFDASQILPSLEELVIRERRGGVNMEIGPEEAGWMVEDIAKRRKIGFGLRILGIPWKYRGKAWIASLAGVVQLRYVEAL